MRGIANPAIFDTVMMICLKNCKPYFMSQNNSIIPKRGMSSSDIFVVLGIIAVLFAVFLLFLNPLESFSEMRDAERKNKVHLLLDATLRCALENGGALMSGLENLPAGKLYIIGTEQSDCDVCNTIETEKSCIDLGKSSCGQLRFVPDYISSLPVDPYRKKWSSKNSGYYIGKTSLDHIRVGSCGQELESIEIIKKYK